jgi:hypothetical protein
MRNRIILALTTAILFYCLPLKAEEIPVKSRIESVSMFKNGLAVVKHVLTVDKPGQYVVEDISSDPVHGTFWIDSDAAVKVRVTYQEITSDQLSLDRLNLQEGFAGQEVEISFKEPGQTPLKGTIEHMVLNNTWDQNYNPRGHYDYYSYRSDRNGQPTPFFGLSLIVRKSDGLEFVDQSAISHLKVLSTKTTVKMRKPVLILQVEAVNKTKTSVGISYLTKGLSWAPSYRIALLDAVSLSIEQSAVIKNEYADIDDVEMKLITGFPQVKFAHVTSPLSLKTNLSQFFTQLNQPPVAATGLASNAMVQQQTISVNEPISVSDLDLGSASQGEGVDLYYRSIGKNTLKEGDALFTSLAKAKAPYERIIEWVVPDTRRANGRPVEDYERQQHPDKYQDAAWDAISFKNPFDFPMTTATASIYAQGQFNGQSQSNWVNPGEKSVIYVTKALSIMTSFSEQEEPGERVMVKLAGNQYQKVTVTGNLAARNNRAQAITMLVRRQFSGDLVSATGSPESKLREEGIDSMNKRNELKWNFSLQSGEEKKITYSYTVLIPY